MIIGNSSAPTGIGSRGPMTAPNAASATVASNQFHSTGGNHTTCRTAPPDPIQNLETSEAMIAINATRKYCIKATRRTSSPYASAINVITIAAPGNDPQIAAVPGSTRQRINSQLSALLTMSTAITALRNS